MEITIAVAYVSMLDAELLVQSQFVSHTVHILFQ